MTEAPPRRPASPPSQLRRSGEGRFLMGVCAGLGRYTRIDPVVFRVAFAVLLLGSGIGLFLYLAAYLLMKEPNGRPGIIEQWTRRDFDAETVMALLTAVLAFGLAINLATVWLDMGSLVVGVFLAVSLLAAHTHGVDLVALVRSMPERLSRRRPSGSASFGSGHGPASPVTGPQGRGAPAGAAPPTTAVRRPAPATEPGRERADSPVGPSPAAGASKTSGTSAPEGAAPGGKDASLEREAAATRQEGLPVEEAVSGAMGQAAPAEQAAGDAPGTATPAETAAGDTPGKTTPAGKAADDAPGKTAPAEQAAGDAPGKTTPAAAIEGLRQAAAGVRDAAYRARRERQDRRGAPAPGAQPPHEGAATTPHEAAPHEAAGHPAQAQGADRTAAAKDADRTAARETDRATAREADQAAARQTDQAAARQEQPREDGEERRADWQERQYWREQFEGPVSPEAVTAEHPVPPHTQQQRQQGYRPDPPTAVDHGQGEPFAPHGPYRPLDPARRTAAYSPYDPALYQRPMPGPHPAPPRRPRRAPQPKSYIGAMTILLAIIVGGIVVVAQTRSAAGVSPTIVGGAMLITIGAGLLVAAWWGRGAGLVAGGTAVALVIGVGLMLGGVPKNIGPAEWTPTSLAEANRLFDVGVGDGTLDLSELELPPGTKVTFNAAVQAGELEVIVPPTARVEVHATNKVGDIVIGQSLRGGVDLRVDKVLEPEVEPEGKVSTIVLNIKGGLGDMTVRHAA